MWSFEQDKKKLPRENLSHIFQSICGLSTTNHTIPSCTWKMTLSLYAMKAYRGSGCAAPVILNLSSRWRWEVSLMPRPLYPARMSSRCPMNTRMGWHNTWYGRFEPEILRMCTQWAVIFQLFYTGQTEALKPTQLQQWHFRAGPDLSILLQRNVLERDG